MKHNSIYLRFTFALSLLLLATFVNASDTKPSGTIVIDETQVMLLIGGSKGGGTLLLEDDSYSFKTSGVTAGAKLGVEKMHVTGNVYHLEDVKNFPGNYFELEATLALVEGVGGLWLKNKHGVTLHLKANIDGAAIAIGAEGMKITMD